MTAKCFTDRKVSCHGRNNHYASLALGETASFPDTPYKKDKIFFVSTVILEEFNLNITKTAFTTNSIHHLYSLTIIQFCNVTDSILIQPLGLALEKALCHSQRLP